LRQYQIEETEVAIYTYRIKNYFQDELPVSCSVYVVNGNHRPLHPGQYHNREFWKISAIIPPDTGRKEMLICKNNKIDVRSGIIYLVSPNDLMTLFLSDGTRIFNILILDDFIQDLVKDLHKISDFYKIFESESPEKDCPLLYTPIIPHLMKLIKDLLYETAHTDANTPAMLKHLLGVFLIEFERNYRMRQMKLRSKNLISGFESYLRENFLSRIRLETAAREFGVTEKYLHSRFRKETGHTIKEYLNELRLAYAVKNLENTKLGISEIRQRSGFPNPNCFFTAFRRKFGCTPQEYREMKRLKKT